MASQLLLSHLFLAGLDFSRLTVDAKLSIQESSSEGEGLRVWARCSTTVRSGASLEEMEAVVTSSNQEGRREWVFAFWRAGESLGMDGVVGILFSASHRRMCFEMAGSAFFVGFFLLLEPMLGRTSKTRRG